MLQLQMSLLWPLCIPIKEPENTELLTSVRVSLNLKKASTLAWLNSQKSFLSHKAKWCMTSSSKIRANVNVSRRGLFQPVHLQLWRVYGQHVTKLSHLQKKQLKQVKPSVKYYQEWGHSKRQTQTQGGQRLPDTAANEQNCTKIKTITCQIECVCVSVSKDH